MLTTLRRDVRRVGTDVRREGFKGTVGRTFADLEAFYLSTHAQARLAGMGLVKRWLFLSWWLLKSLLLKLTPARRVLLALSLLLIVTGPRGVLIGTNGGPQISLNLPILSIVLVLLVLMLELKDKLLAQDELEAGRKVQLALMPERSPRVAGWELWLYTQPANDVGGD
ncbi:MAG: hypothetical protein IMZ55_19150, partial [Acidobacteria bacterium]|nr:hypothetical protein [Acidobacteriota bacterium]